MIISFLLFGLGLLLLIKGAGWLVEGASSVSLRLKISPLVIGLTVVAFGTSAPELLVSVFGALRGSTDLALGNVVGSNIFNILIVLGASAIIFPLRVQLNTVWKEIPFSFLAAIVMAVLGLQTLLDRKDFSHLLSSLNSSDVLGSITFSNGLILLSFFVIFMYYTFGISKVQSEQFSLKQLSIPLSILLVTIGLSLLALGSRVTVENAVALARSMGFSENFIGLTLVATGTSLPELVTSVTAALKKDPDIAVGNVVGSNIFNIFLILGVTSLVRTIPLNGENLADILVLFGSTVLLFVSLFIWKKHLIGRVEGFVMVVAYFSYITFLVVRG